MQIRARSWQEQACAKRLATSSKIPTRWQLEPEVLDDARSQRVIAGSYIERLLDKRTVQITSREGFEIVKDVADRVYTAEEVAGAFCKRAAFSQQLNNCLHEIFFEDALERARELDAHYAETGKTIGPLHGLPISLKDQFHVEGVETTMGYVGWIDTYEGHKDTGRERATNSLLVSDLFELGAILYCKLGETVNNIFGRTMNPMNQNLSCGGSSGGECALMALRGSCLGAGSDIGGSVRIPAAFCGIFSIKPSAARFSYKNVANSIPGQMTMSSAIGFMSTSLLSLRLLMQTVLARQPWLLDPDVVPLPWRADEECYSDKELCFGLLATDQMVTPHPPVSRAIRLVCHAIAKAGHRIIEWKPPKHETGTNLHSRILGSDGGDDIFNQLELSGEPLIPQKAKSFPNGREPPIPYLDFLELCLARKRYRSEYAEYWTSTAEHSGTVRPVDAVIMPVAPHAAVIPGCYFHYGYTEIVNLLDYTSVVIPVTYADKDVDTFDEDYQPLNDKDDANWKAYDAEVYDGAPVGIQIMGRGLQEERILAIARMVHDALSEP